MQKHGQNLRKWKFMTHYFKKNAKNAKKVPFLEKYF